MLSTASQARIESAYDLKRDAIEHEEILSLIRLGEEKLAINQ